LGINLCRDIEAALVDAEFGQFTQVDVEVEFGLW